jgi:hypothetical protein
MRCLGVYSCLHEHLKAYGGQQHHCLLETVPLPSPGSYAQPMHYGLHAHPLLDEERVAHHGHHGAKTWSLWSAVQVCSAGTPLGAAATSPAGAIGMACPCLSSGGVTTVSKLMVGVADRHCTMQWVRLML